MHDAGKLCIIRGNETKEGRVARRSLHYKKDQTKWRGPLRSAPPSPLATFPTVFDLRRIPKKVAKKPAAKKCCCKKAPAKKAVAKKPVKKAAKKAKK